VSKHNPTFRLAENDQSKLSINKRHEIAVDENRSDSDELLWRLAKMPPEPRMRPVKSGKKMDPPPDYEVKIEGVPAERYIVQWFVEERPLAEAYQKHHYALERAGRLFDEYGPNLEIEIHLNRVRPPPSLLYNAVWLRKWDRSGRPPVQG